MEILQYLHSYLRWVVLALALIVIAKSLMGWLGNKSYEKLDNTLSASFLGSLHLQLILGLILYVIGDKGLSLITNNGMAEVMKDADLRFWAVEHMTTMIIAIVVATIGRSKSKRVSEAVAKHKQVVIFYGIALLLILSRIPWTQVPLLKGLG